MFLKFSFITYCWWAAKQTVWLHSSLQQTAYCWQFAMSLSTTLCALQGLLARFASQAGLWQRAVKSMAELDALMSLAFAAQFGGDGAPMCRPTFVEPQSPSSEGSTGHVSTSAVHLAQDSASVFFIGFAHLLNLHEQHSGSWPSVGPRVCR